MQKSKYQRTIYQPRKASLASKDITSRENLQSAPSTKAPVCQESKNRLSRIL